MNLKNLLLIATMALSSATIVAQDQLASLAPVDRHVRRIDSVSIARILDRENLQNPAFSLYQSWDNKYTKDYGVELPDEYKIDLRNFHMPCDSRLVTSHYGYRRAFRRNHYGTDIKVYTGDTIRAAFNGRIRIVADQGRRTGYGKYIIIRHPNGLETVYGHLSKHLVTEDQVIKAGQPIGLGGNTGRSTGSHLHFEARFLGHFIDPEKLFDFQSQDILADYYMFRSSGRGFLIATSNNDGGEGAELSEQEIAQAEQKAAESEQFQKDRRETIRRSVHKVRSGESLYTIAKKYHTTVAQLSRLNNISTKSTLRIGQIIRYN